MKYGVSIRSYKGMYFVEYHTKSVGVTLLATWDKEQAESEYNKIINMSENARKQYIHSPTPAPEVTRARKDSTVKEVKYFVRGNSPYIAPHYMALSELPAELREGEKLAHEAMREAGTAHAVYAVKKYAEDGAIEQVDFYNPPVCLDDDEFYKRTDAEAQEHHGCLIYAVHAR